MLDEGDDTALVEKHLLLCRLFPLVLQRDRQALVQEGQFTQTLGQDIETVFQRLENLTVRFESDFGPSALGDAGVVERGSGLSALISLLEHLAILPNFQLQPFRERIHYGNADAMETARNRVRSLLELPARMQHRERDLRGGLF